MGSAMAREKRMPLQRERSPAKPDGGSVQASASNPLGRGSSLEVLPERTDAPMPWSDFPSVSVSGLGPSSRPMSPMSAGRARRADAYFPAAATAAALREVEAKQESLDDMRTMSAIIS